MKTTFPRSRKLHRNLFFFSAILLALLISVWARAEQVSLAWQPNTESNLAGYKVHYGTASRNYSVHIDVQKVTTCTVTGLTAGQTYYFATTAYDTSGNQSGYSNEVNYSTQTPPSQSSYRLNSGGVQYTNAQGNVYGADKYFSGGSTATISNAIDGTVDDLLYQSERYGNFSYALPLANGTYTVVLKFAEIYWGQTGKRVFDVWIEGQRAIGSLDIFARVGKNRVYDVSVPVSVADGVLNIEFRTLIDNAKVSAIEVKAGQTPPLPGNSAPLTPATPSGPSSGLLNTAYSFSTTTTDPNGDAIEYRYDWGNGVVSGWGATSRSYSWAAAGNYSVRAQARDSLGLESAWSSASMVTIEKDSDGDGVPDSRDAFPNDPKEWADVNGNGIGDNADALAAKAPEVPVLILPVDDAVTSTLTVLKTGDFRTAQAGVTHAKTRWQVFRDEDSACVLDVTSTTALTSLTLPRLVLDEGTPYFWRAQFIDSQGAASAWPDYEHFSTQVTSTDRNSNGIPDAQEVGSKTDLDRDGVRDYQQTTIKSLNMVGTRFQIGVSIKGCATVLTIEAVASEALPAGSSVKNFPFGLINFKVAAAKLGDPVTVKLYFSDTAPLGSKWYRYDSVSRKWYDASAYAILSSDRKSVTLTLADGGAGDADGAANAVIVNAGGLFVP